jgi:uncharacterized protein
MSEFLNSEFKQEKLKSIIKSLHQGKPVESVKKEFGKIIKRVSPEEISAMENELIKEGIPPEQVQRLCDVHVSVFENSLKQYKSPKHIPGHPVHTFLEENKAAKKLLKSVLKLLKKLNKNNKEVTEKLSNKLKELQKIEIHFQRKENQLFPKLEKRNFSGPSKVMWGKHDEIRMMFKSLKTEFDSGRYGEVKVMGNKIAKAMKNMFFMEEKILFPSALRKLEEQDWIDIRKEEPEIGYAWVKPGSLWDINIAESRQKSPEEKNENPEKDKFHIDEGNLTINQINLLLKNLPVDVTFVDENDQVLYYSDSKERVFPRSPAIIGRKVQNCHPPKSVHIVDKIIKCFRNKEKDVAEFWLTLNNRFIHIKYLALYDVYGDYKGVIEVSQDATEIRKLKGERRLLDW